MVTDLDEAPIEIVRGSGNAFADLGLPDPEERLDPVSTPEVALPWVQPRAA